jgi:uroporphyrinogen decarboxylase
VDNAVRQAEAVLVKPDDQSARLGKLTPREKFIMALEGRQPPGLVPHFELVFYLTMEAFGRVHPCQRHYAQWNQMSEEERRLHREDIADLYVTVARKYEHSAVFFHPPGGWGADTDAETMRTLEIIRRVSGMDYFLMSHGDATYGIPDGSGMMKFAEDIAERPQQLKDNAQRMVDEALSRARQFRRHGVLDGYALCSDYCFNSGPFLSPKMFEEFIAPYLARLVAGYREMGFYVIKHTDGNIMPILDGLLAARPHALHSLDPQGGVDIAEVKRLAGDKVCLIGNVNCGALQTGSQREVIDSARYALRCGMPGGGYVFSTSNCIYTGLPLERYELMLDVWRKEGRYD